MWILNPCDCLGLQLCVGVVFPDGMQLIDPVPIDAGRCGKTGHLRLQGHVVGTVMNWSKLDVSKELGRAAKKKELLLKPIEFQHQAI